MQIDYVEFLIDIILFLVRPKDSFAIENYAIVKLLQSIKPDMFFVFAMIPSEE